jgi:micrococcal nuclease
MQYLTFVMLLLFIPQNEFKAQVTTVEDGDTFEIVTSEKKKIVVRLFGVDCPEDGQAFSSKAKQFVEALCRNKTVKVVKNVIDPHGRLVADVYLPDGRSVAKELLKAGYAWHYKQYSNDKELDHLEQEARKHKKGLWNEENPMSPWDYRVSKQAKH